MAVGGWIPDIRQRFHEESCEMLEGKGIQTLVQTIHLYSFPKTIRPLAYTNPATKPGYGWMSSMALLWCGAEIPLYLY